MIQRNINLHLLEKLSTGTDRKKQKEITQHLKEMVKRDRKHRVNNLPGILIL